MFAIKRKSTLVKRIILGMTLGVLCQNFTSAAEHETVYVSGGGKEMFEVLYFNKGEALYYDINKPHTTANTLFGPSEYNLSNQYKRAIEKGLSYWAEMLGPNAQNSTPTQIFIFTEEKYGNAGALSETINFTTFSTSNENYIKEAIQNDHPLSHLDPFNGIQPEGWKSISEIIFGENMGASRAGSEGGWYIDAETVLPTNEQAADYLGTIRHEMGHALGIDANIATMVVDNKKAQDEYLNYIVCFSPNSSTDETTWDMHLVDQNLNKAQPGMNIVTTARYNKIAADNPNAKVSDYFILDNLQTNAPYDTTNPRAGKLYFVGTNVTDALHGATFDGVSGIPINGWERIGDPQTGKIVAYVPELSHIQTPGMMSHVAYSNYTSFMEVELAVMQDLGYKFDRRNYFGFSEYDNNLSYTNTNGYSARNPEGTAYLPGVYNQTPLGIGLHVYGSNNNIIQAADILTIGDGAAGMRIDGAGNTVTIAKDTSVRSDGYRGIGALIAYGNSQVLNQAGTISANGEKGVGVQFDFGSSSNGASDEYRGSYIRYQRDVDEKTGKITEGENLKLTDKNGNTDPTPELNSSLVKEYNLSGALSAATHAIYIGKNAFVENINVNNGASITGDITSEWKHFNTDGSYDGVKGNGSDALKLQYKGTNYAYNCYIPKLVTNLNFNANINYAGNISGKDNMRIKVGSGTLNYTGTADVVSVEVAKDASLLGSGSYSVYDWNTMMPTDYTDEKMGQLINYGTIGATTGDVNINGKLTSKKGNIDIVPTENGSRVYLLNVNGHADISDSKLLAGEKNKPLLAKKYLYLTTDNGITGNILTGDLSDYVRVTGTVEGNNAFFTTLQIKNLEDTTGLNANERSLARAFNKTAPNLMQQNNVAGQQAANVFYNNAGDMKKLMNSVTAAERTKLLGQTPMSNLTANSIYSRLDTNAFDGTVTVPVQVPALDGESQTINTNIPMVLDTNNNFWIKMFRGFENYGGIDGDSDLNSKSFGGVIGYDKSAGQDARLGGFFAYGKTNYNADYMNGNSSDWRLGLYGDKRNGDWEYQGLISYGANHYDLDAYTWDSGVKLNSDFKAKIWDLGLKAKYTIPSTKTKTWKIRPYGELGYTHTAQDSYTESGNSAFAKDMDSASNNSTRAELGVEFKRSITPTTGWGGAIGYKRILSGVNPELNGTFIGGTDSFTVRTENDRNYLTYNLNVHTSLGGKWTGQAEFRGEKSSNNHKEVYSIAAKYHF